MKVPNFKVIHLVDISGWTEVVDRPTDTYYHLQHGRKGAQEEVNLAACQSVLENKAHFPATVTPAVKCMHDCGY